MSGVPESGALSGEASQRQRDDETLSEAASLEALHRALQALRRGIDARNVEAPARSEGVLWEPSFGGDRLRAGRFGMSERAGDVDEFGVDRSSLERARPVLDFLMDRFFRIEVRGLDSLRKEEPALLVANRSGILPYDGIMLAHAVARAWPDRPGPRFLVEAPLMALPFVQPYLARIGGVLSCAENADRLLGGGHTVIAFPEGERGAAKVFAERYRLKPFGGAEVIRAALARGVPLLPVGIVGAEEAYPVLFSGRAPGLGPVPVTPTFPLLGPLGLLPIPTKWVVQIGRPIEAKHLEVSSSFAERDLARVCESLQSRVQHLVDQALDQRGSMWAR